MKTIRQLSGEQLDALVTRLMNKVKANVFARGVSGGAQMLLVRRVIPFYVDYNFKHARYGAGGLKGSDR